jgi:hypothetical protein
VNLHIPWHHSNPSRVRHARSLIDEAVVRLDRIDGCDHPGPPGEIQLLAALAATARDRIAEIIDLIAADERDWDEIAAAQGLTKAEAWRQWRADREDPAAYTL